MCVPPTASWALCTRVKKLPLTIFPPQCVPSYWRICIHVCDMPQMYNNHFMFTVIAIHEFCLPYCCVKEKHSMMGNTHIQPHSWWDKSTLAFTADKPTVNLPFVCLVIYNVTHGKRITWTSFSHTLRNHSLGRPQTQWSHVSGQYLELRCVWRQVCMNFFQLRKASGITPILPIFHSTVVRNS